MLPVMQCLRGSRRGRLRCETAYQASSVLLFCICFVCVREASPLLTLFVVALFLCVWIAGRKAIIVMV